MSDRTSSSLPRTNNVEVVIITKSMSSNQSSMKRRMIDSFTAEESSASSPTYVVQHQERPRPFVRGLNKAHSRRAELMREQSAGRAATNTTPSSLSPPIRITSVRSSNTPTPSSATLNVIPRSYPIQRSIHALHKTSEKQDRVTSPKLAGTKLCREHKPQAKGLKLHYISPADTISVSVSEKEEADPSALITDSDESDSEIERRLVTEATKERKGKARQRDNDDDDDFLPHPIDIDKDECSIRPVDEAALKRDVQDLYESNACAINTGTLPSQLKGSSPKRRRSRKTSRKSIVPPSTLPTPPLKSKRISKTSQAAAKTAEDAPWNSTKKDAAMRSSPRKRKCKPSQVFARESSDIQILPEMAANYPADPFGAMFGTPLQSRDAISQTHSPAKLPTILIPPRYQSRLITPPPEPNFDMSQAEVSVVQNSPMRTNANQNAFLTALGASDMQRNGSDQDFSALQLMTNASTTSPEIPSTALIFHPEELSSDLMWAENVDWALLDATLPVTEISASLQTAPMLDSVISLGEASFSTSLLNGYCGLDIQTSELSTPECNNTFMLSCNTTMASSICSASPSETVISVASHSTDSSVYTPPLSDSAGSMAFHSELEQLRWA